MRWRSLIPLSLLSVVLAAAGAVLAFSPPKGGETFTPRAPGAQVKVMAERKATKHLRSLTMTG